MEDRRWQMEDGRYARAHVLEGARASRPLSSASRRRALAHQRRGNPAAKLFGETPNRATGTVALPVSFRCARFIRFRLADRRDLCFQFLDELR